MEISVVPTDGEDIEIEKALPASKEPKPLKYPMGQECPFGLRTIPLIP